MSGRLAVQERGGTTVCSGFGAGTAPTIYSESGVGCSGRIPEQRFKPEEDLIGYDFTSEGARRILVRAEARAAPEGASCPAFGARRPGPDPCGRSAVGRASQEPS